MVELSLPGAFNPLGSRLAVSGFGFLAFAGTYGWPGAAARAELWLDSFLWLLTLHYFYLFDGNQADINWVVGSYITVIAAGACIQTDRRLLAYSTYVLALPVLFRRSIPSSCARFSCLGWLRSCFSPTWACGPGPSLLAWSEETSRWFRNLFDAVFEGIVVHEGGVIVDCNESFARIFGYRARRSASAGASRLS